MNETEKEDEILFETYEYAYISLELGILLLIIVYFIISWNYHGSFDTMVMEDDRIALFGGYYVFLRGLRKMYSAFVLKNYKLIFYKDRIEETRLGRKLYLKDYEIAYKVYGSTSFDIATRFNIFKKLVLILVFPVHIFLFFILFARFIASVFYSKKIFPSQFSLVVVFPLDGKETFIKKAFTFSKVKESVVNIPFGFLTEEEKLFVKQYFEDYLDIKLLKKSFLLLPHKEG